MSTAMEEVWHGETPGPGEPAYLTIGVSGREVHGFESSPYPSAAFQSECWQRLGPTQSPFIEATRYTDAAGDPGEYNPVRSPSKHGIAVRLSRVSPSQHSCSGDARFGSREDRKPAIRPRSAPPREYDYEHLYAIGKSGSPKHSNTPRFGSATGFRSTSISRMADARAVEEAARATREAIADAQRRCRQATRSAELAAVKAATSERAAGKATRWMAEMGRAPDGGGAGGDGGGGRTRDEGRVDIQVEAEAAAKLCAQAARMAEEAMRAAERAEEAGKALAVVEATRNKPPNAVGYSSAHMSTSATMGTSHSSTSSTTSSRQPRPHHPVRGLPTTFNGQSERQPNGAPADEPVTAERPTLACAASESQARTSPGERSSSRGMAPRSEQEDRRSSSFRSASPHARSYVRQTLSPGVGSYEPHTHRNQVEAGLMAHPDASYSIHGSSMFAATTAERNQARPLPDSTAPSPWSTGRGERGMRCQSTRLRSHLDSAINQQGSHLAPGTYHPSLEATPGTLFAKIHRAVNPRLPGFGSSTPRLPNGGCPKDVYRNRGSVHV